ncbi:hypothetical protein H4684_003415 [Desulfomicrobium macestii]|uniref:Uncharacterized protein n=1 Tax=Desulfomicrobium macestii TaxID=90731 RepID=A0ABR9H7P3_9BACT|nr:hypothetical protein [Desulfomicrobium macestii]MBE1426741.1 hypothetical protein [Desulfomicrobium macestii]
MQEKLWKMGRREQSADKDDIARHTFILHFSSAENFHEEKRDCGAQTEIHCLVLFWSERVWSGGGEYLVKFKIQDLNPVTAF